MPISPAIMQKNLQISRSMFGDELGTLLFTSCADAAVSALATLLLILPFSAGMVSLVPQMLQKTAFSGLVLPHFVHFIFSSPFIGNVFTTIILNILSIVKRLSMLTFTW